MIQMNTDHPRFNMKFEVLASIPRSPVACNTSVLAKDLGISHRRICYHITRLRDFDGHGITSRNRAEVSIRRAGWNAACIEARKYWDAVYGATK